MEYVTQYTVQEVCDIIGVELPEEYSYMANDVLTNLANGPTYAREGGAYFLYARTRAERKEKFERIKKSKLKILFAGEICRGMEELKEMPCIYVKNISDKVIKLAVGIREKVDIKVVGITGSLGKTTTKDLVFSVLNQGFKTVKSLGNQNTIFPIFNNLQKMSYDTEVFVQEFGVGTPGVLPKTVRACVPNVGIITNISEPHLDVFGTKENILAEKLSMIEQMPEGCPAFLNYDDELLRDVLLENRPIISYAVNNKNADYYAENIRVYDDYMTFDIVHEGKRIEARLNAHGTHNIGNALVAAAVGEWFGMTEKQIVDGIATFRSGGIRQNLTNIGGYKLYIDCYNTAPISLLGSIEILDNLNLEEGGKRIAVMGDIVRLGEREKELHVEVGQKISKSKLDIALCFGNENAKLLADTLRENGVAALYTDKREELNDWMRGLVTRKDITLIKGPVARLLSRTIDQVYGTSLHTSSEHFDWVNVNGYRAKVIYEKTDHDNKMVALVKYSGTECDVKVPSQIDNQNVFSVGVSCFEQNLNISSVEISAPIFNVSDFSFRGCRKLKSIQLPKTLKYIGNGAFLNCVQLEEVEIPEGVIHVGNGAFEGCKMLKKVKVPKTIGFMGENVFKGCPNVVIEYTE